MQADRGAPLRRGARGIGSYVAIALAVIALLASGCSKDSASSSSLPPENGPATPGGRTPGVTADTITIAVSGPRTGLGDFYATMEKAGTGVWLNEVNANGGIHGRKIVIKPIDNKFTPDGAIAACQEEKSADVLFTVISAGYGSEATCVQEAGVPAFLFLVDQVDPKWTSTVHYLQSVRTWGRNPADLVKQVAPDSKIGILYLTDLAYGFEGKNGFEERANELGLHVVATEAVSQGQASFVPELQRLQAAGADTVLMFVVTDAIGILRDAGSMGYSPRWFGSGFGEDVLAQAVRDPMEGVISVRTFATEDSDAYKFYLDKFEKYADRGLTPSADAMSGYGQGLLIQAVLEAAGPEPTRQGVIDAFETFDGFGTHGIFPPVTWGGRLDGTDETFAVVCCDANFAFKAFDGGSPGK